MYEIVKICEKHGNLFTNDAYKENRKNGLYLRCKNCAKENIEKFKIKHPGRNNESGRRSRNKHYEKLRWVTIKKKFGISKDDYEKLSIIQNHLCAICFKPEKAKDRKGRGVSKFLCVDHSHITKKIRGLLYRNCNAGIGNLYDSIEYLESAIKYLKTSK